MVALGKSSRHTGRRVVGSAHRPREVAIAAAVAAARAAASGKIIIAATRTKAVRHSRVTREQTLPATARRGRADRPPDGSRPCRRDTTTKGKPGHKKNPAGRRCARGDTPAARAITSLSRYRMAKGSHWRPNMGQPARAQVGSGRMRRQRDTATTLAHAGA